LNMMEAKIEPVVLTRLEEIAEQHRDVTPDEKEKLCGQFSLDAPEIGAKLRELFAKQHLALDRARLTNLSERLAKVKPKIEALKAEKAETLTALPAKEEEQPAAAKPKRRPLPPDPSEEIAKSEADLFFSPPIQPQIGEPQNNNPTIRLLLELSRSRRNRSGRTMSRGRQSQRRA
jgi:hypothetical protein